MNTQAIPLTNPPKHHFFGFHDISAWNYRGDKILSLEVDAINRPPLPNENARVGYVDQELVYKIIGGTSAFNFPQGSRMQWVGRSDSFVVNNIWKDSFGCDIYDATINRIIDRVDFPCHHLHKNGFNAFSINYARLYRLGAYGYAGIDDFSKFDPTPTNDGIYIGNLNTNKGYLLISINEVANFPKKQTKKSYGHHYLTHLLLNPSNNRLAFLHRYPLPDGGENTRLLTIATDGTEMRCLATGFLSHFDWKDDETIFIYGRANNSLDLIRSNPLMSMPLVKQAASLGKKMLQSFLTQRITNSANFILIKDADNSTPTVVAKEILTEDGHPMFCPSDRDLIVNDTYPNKEGIRELMLYDFKTNKKNTLGTYKMLSNKPEMTFKTRFFEYVDVEVIKTIGEDELAFTRSGLHCDLHPRWDMKGEKIAFDSIHEGTRQLYMLDLKK